jgi:hypothetical protein
MLTCTQCFLGPLKLGTSPAHISTKLESSTQMTEDKALVPVSISETGKTDTSTTAGIAGS